MMRAFLKGIVTATGKTRFAGTRPKNCSTNFSPDSVSGTSEMLTVAGLNSELCITFTKSGQRYVLSLCATTSLRRNMLIASEQISSNCPQRASSSVRSGLMVTGICRLAKATASDLLHLLIWVMASSKRSGSCPLRSRTNANSAVLGGANFSSGTLYRSSLVCVSSQFMSPSVEC